MLVALTPSEKQDLVMSVGVHRRSRRISPCKVAQLLKKASAQQSLREIARDVDLRDDTVLRRLLSLLKLPPEVQALISWGKTPGTISFSVASEVARLVADEEIEQLAAAGIEHRLSKEEVRGIIQRKRRANVSLDRAVEDVLKLRPVVERQYLFLGLLSDDVNEEKARRNIRQRLSSLLGSRNVLAVKCRNHRFSIVLTPEGANSDRVRRFLSPANLQTYINSLAKG